MYAFNDETLKYLLNRIKDQLDKKQSKQQYLMQVGPDEEGALIIGTDAIDEELINESGLPNGTAVIIKEMIMTEVNFTLEEKQALNSSSSSANSQENLLEERLAGNTFKLMAIDDFNFEKLVNGLESGILYIVSDDVKNSERSIIVAIDDYIKEIAELEEFNNTKVNKVEGKQLSQADFTNERKSILDEINTDTLLFTENIIDDLSSDSSSSILSANQGRLLKDEYLGGYGLEYVEPEEHVYGLSESQLKMLGETYSNSFAITDDKFASKKEIYDARKNSEGKSFDTLYNRINDLESRLRSAAINIDYIEHIADYYGVQFDFEEQEYTRLGKAVNADFNTVYPWAGIKRCNVLNGEVIAYEGNDTYKEDGSNGDVMVEIPKFWYKVVPVRTEPASSGEGLQLVEAKWMISNKALKNFKVHPAFIRNGIEVDHIYVGAFEACIYDTSANAYLTMDEQMMNVDEDTLASIIGVKPCSGTTQTLTLDNCRTMAQRKGTGYGLIDFTASCALQLLLLIEYASFDSQTCVGQGIVGLQGSGNISLNTGSEQAVVYRGIENLWGNIWTYIDGIDVEINASDVYAHWSNDDYLFTTHNLLNKISFKLPASGYIDRFGYDEKNDFVFLPTRATGSSSIAPYDNYYMNLEQHQGYLGASLGGYYTDAQRSGLWYWYLCIKKDTRKESGLGTRIQFYK